jgi:hypothetical protein
VETFISTKNTFLIQSNDETGEIWLSRHEPDASNLLVKNEEETIELFGLICLFITERVLTGWQWTVSNPPDDKGTDWTEDDVPY